MDADARLLAVTKICANMEALWEYLRIYIQLAQQMVQGLIHGSQKNDLFTKTIAFYFADRIIKLLMIILTSIQLNVWKK